MLTETPFHLVFGSPTRTRILYILATKGEINISELVKGAQANHANVQKHLAALVGMGVLQEIVFGTRIKVYRINASTKEGKAVQAMINLWNKTVRGFSS